MRKQTSRWFARRLCLAERPIERELAERNGRPPPDRHVSLITRRHEASAKCARRISRQFVELAAAAPCKLVAQFAAAADLMRLRERKKSGARNSRNKCLLSALSCRANNLLLTSRAHTEPAACEREREREREFYLHLADEPIQVRSSRANKLQQAKEELSRYGLWRRRPSRSRSNLSTRQECRSSEKAAAAAARQTNAPSCAYPQAASQQTPIVCPTAAAAKGDTRATGPVTQRMAVFVRHENLAAV